MIGRLTTQWVYGGMLAGLLLLLLAPTLTHGWSVPLTATFLLLPIYMLHQYEEHDNDRFRLAFNELIGKGKEVLTPAAVFIINVPGVWGVLGASWVMAARFNVGWSLVAVYVVLVNAFAHIVQGIRLQAYNPGLVTAVVLFLPFGVHTWRQVYLAGGGTFGYQIIGLAVAMGFHAAILMTVHQKQRSMASDSGNPTVL